MQTSLYQTLNYGRTEENVNEFYQYNKNMFFKGIIYCTTIFYKLTTLLCETSVVS